VNEATATAGGSGEEGGFGGWVIRLTGSRRTPALELLPLDLGRPPQVAEVRDCRCVFDGIVHDRDELERAAGIDVRPGTNDAEVILHAYLRLGESVLGRLKGIFAFAIWDGETLLCCRDRLGIYPLFRAEADGDLLVSTSVGGLLAQHGVSAAVNLAVLVDHIRHRWLHAEETFFEAVRRIPAGHLLRAKGRVQTLTRYWDPAPPESPVAWIGPDEIEHFDSLLQTAVDRCVRADETGIFLSGGLDSVTVAALAAGEEPKPWALSLAFPDPLCNEEVVQRKVAARLGLPQVMLAWDDAVGRDGLVSAALELTPRLATPLINLWAPAYDELARTGHDRGCRVILTGSGGDEWLGVSPYYAADLMRRLDVVGFARLFDNLRRSYPLSARRHLAHVLWRFGARPLVKRGAAAVMPGPLEARKQRAVPAAIPAWLAPDDELRRQIVERELDAYSRSLKPLRRLSPSHPAVYIEQMRTALIHPLVSMELEETFEQGRRLGMKFLHPFLDSDLVEFLYRTPPELLNRGGRSKGLVRGALARRLPELGFDVQKKVIATEFTRELMARETLPAWREAGGIPSLIEIGAVDGARVDELLQRLSTSASLPDRLKLWDLLSSDVWFRAKRGEGALKWANTPGSP
jgi:asparagine synthase (glutamine-hydrolysing)